MAWIESHQSLVRHPKLLRLARMLDIPKAQAIGHLHLLWWWVLDYAPDGDVSAFNAGELEAAAEWAGDAGRFRAALEETGWLDADGRIHDWQDYAGRIVGLRAANRERQHRHRATKRNGPVTRDTPVTSRTGHGAESRPVTGLPNPTQPNPTQPTEPTRVCAHTPRARDAISPEVASPPAGAPTEEGAHTPGPPEVASRVIPNLEAVLQRAQQMGLAEWKARDWFDEMEGCGWQDYAGRDIRRWEAVLQRIAVKWRADGSPSAPPAKVPAGSAARGRVATPIDHSKGF